MSRTPLTLGYFTVRTRVDKQGCWLWLQGQLNNGYGACQGRTAHKAAYETLVGPVPAGKVVRHTCDVKLCCNPAHLKIGTQVDNYYDMPAEKRKALHMKSGRTYSARGHGKHIDGAHMAACRKTVGNRYGTFKKDPLAQW
jgi:hypothetical protein